jgi:hypothetical protein
MRRLVQDPLIVVMKPLQRRWSDAVALSGYRAWVNRVIGRNSCSLPIHLRKRVDMGNGSRMNREVPVRFCGGAVGEPPTAYSLRKFAMSVQRKARIRAVLVTAALMTGFVRGGAVGRGTDALQAVSSRAGAVRGGDALVEYRVSGVALGDG